MKQPLTGTVTLRRAVLFVTFLMVAVMFVSRLTAFDLWWHLKAGGEILRTHSVPRADTFSYTAQGRPWTYHSWLSGVAMHLVDRAAGTTGLILLRTALMTASLVLMLVAARRRGVGTGLACVFVLAACFQLQWRALMRPYLFSFLLFGVFYLLLQGASRRAPAPPSEGLARRFSAEGRYLWGDGGRLILLPALTLLWANLHGGFITGLLVLGAFGAGEIAGVVAGREERPWLRELLRHERGARFRVLLVVGVASLAAGIVTPYGPGVLTYPFRLMAQVKLVREIQEWQPLPWASGYEVFWSVMILSVCLFAASAWRRASNGTLRREFGPLCADLLLMAGFGLLAFSSVRNLAWPMLLAAPVLGYHLTSARGAAEGGEEAGSADAERRERPYLVLAGVLALVLGGQHVLGASKFGFGVHEARLPVRACDYLERSPIPGNLYNVYEWGGYLIGRFGPEKKVFIDGRCLVYRDDIIGEAMTVARGEEGWRGVLAKYDVAAILIRYRERDSSHFFTGGEWHCVYWDDQAIVAVSEKTRLEQFGDGGLLDLSNPAVFERRLSDSPPQSILAEVDGVLEADPTCWTAWTLKARCLLKMAAADEAAAEGLVTEALEAARQAVRLKRGSPDAWRALGLSLEAAGESDASREALSRSESLSD
ncbi:MAG: hypothetical protein QGH74_02660 [Candidatus Brocadiia bacterium]|nr:hypothetical protein [Candidatus Brocadiia bacterium]